MADILKCDNKTCPSAKTCYRFTAPTNEMWQSYGKFLWDSSVGKCNFYWDNKKEINEIEDD